MVTPRSLKTYEHNFIDYLKIFIDSSDEDLKKRLEERHGKGYNFEIRKNEDRKYKYDFDYYITNRSIKDSSQLIIRLFKNRGKGGLFSDGFIRDMIQCGLLIDDADVKNIKGSSYDLIRE